jgi:glycosyltransferase involved in cell wall biosynthesis
MKIAILNTQVPFIRGGAEVHAENLKKAMIEFGYQCDIVSIPFKWYPAKTLIDNIVACRLFDLSETCGECIDQVIGLKFPAYLVPHENKTLWILHQFRTAYDLWESKQFGDLVNLENGKLVRDMIHLYDKSYIPEAKQIYSNSKNVSKRLFSSLNINSTPLYHPPHNYSSYKCLESEKYFFMPSRISSLKRHSLVIEALSLCKENVSVYFAGTPDSEKDFDSLRAQAEKLSVSSKIKWLGSISEQEKLDLYARCLGVIYVPLDEDYGYVTLEAMLASKPVITASDSGGPTEFVINNETGLIVEPNSEELSEALDMLYSSPHKAKEFGVHGRLAYDRLDITWSNVVKRLTSC